MDKKPIEKNDSLTRLILEEMKKIMCEHLFHQGDTKLNGGSSEKVKQHLSYPPARAQRLEGRNVNIQ